MDNHILKHLAGSSLQNPFSYSELAKLVAFEMNKVKLTYISYADLPDDFRVDFQVTLHDLKTKGIVQYISSSGQEPWSGYVFLVK